MLDRSRLSRRSFMQRSAAVAAGAAMAGWSGTHTGKVARAGSIWNPVYEDIQEATIADLQAQMTDGSLTAQHLTGMYLARIAQLDQDGPRLNSVMMTNPDALNIAINLDRERAEGNVRGPLHGIPVLLKDNIDTADQMPNTGGSIALANNFRTQDATIAARLREAGAIVLGKTNLSEWANFRSTQSSSGWSGAGRQTKNPYVLTHNPCGSSSGSGAAASANFAAAAIGTETDGSIVCPANANGLVGIKPTVGLTSRAGVIPIAHSQDTIGPLARTVADAAAVLSAIAGPDPRDAMTAAGADQVQADYTEFLDPDALNGARIGVPRTGGMWGYSPEADGIVEAAIQAMRDMGATVIDPADIPTADQMASSNAEFTVLLYEFKADLNAYLATVGPDVPVRSLADLIEFNTANWEIEMPYFGQEIFEMAVDLGGLDDPTYLAALAESHTLSREQGLDAVLDQYDLDALVAPTGSPAWPTDVLNGDHFLGASSGPAAMAGYPLVSVPAGDSFGLPVNLTFMGRTWSEPTLIALAYAFEQGTMHRRAPRMLPSLDLP
ncbi:MAG: amidase [Thermomicrobiales bacterium]|nr:amidase [Thermomicrobiales bacterium]